MSVTQKSTEQFGISPAIFERIGRNGQCFCLLMDNHTLKEEESGENALVPIFQKEIQMRGHKALQLSSTHRACIIYAP